MHHRVFIQAGNRIRTGDLNLGKVALYQLSYARERCPVGVPGPTGSGGTKAGSVDPA